MPLQVAITCDKTTDQFFMPEGTLGEYKNIIKNVYPDTLFLFFTDEDDILRVYTVQKITSIIIKEVD